MPSPIRLTADVPSPAPTKILYDRKSAAQTLSISIRSLDYLVANKQLNFRRVGKKVMIPHGELVRFARADHAELTGTQGRAN